MELFFIHRGKRYGVEIKFSEAPNATKSMRVAIEDLGLHNLWIVHAGREGFPIDARISALPLRDVARLVTRLK